MGGNIIYKVLNLLGIVAGIKYFCIFAKKLRRGKGTKWLIIIEGMTMRGWLSRMRGEEMVKQ